MTSPNASPRGSVTASEPDGKDDVGSQSAPSRRGPQRRTKSTASVRAGAGLRRASTYSIDVAGAADATPGR